ncbi:hypothetical protein HPB51_018124 [Rhipicephalus microplus]|uniref:Protein O-mannosyl-transferase 2 n=1 Tax=Rhipicephalus microplus TaxID=6941 RepID=A0A9J6E300_RHIMP|nr:hypothetical protein HPB51_018124 [Rhipicephalus microplus]
MTAKMAKKKPDASSTESGDRRKSAAGYFDELARNHLRTVFLVIVLLSLGTAPLQITEPDQVCACFFLILSRQFCALLGSMVPPFCFVIVWELSHSLPAAVLASSLVIFDVGLVTLSQYILLDPILMFFIVGAFMSIVVFKAQSNRPFTKMWWTWLVVSGVFLSCAISVKFVGLFVILLVGFYTAYDLWELLGDLEKPLVLVGKHFVSRALCLILLPMCLYMLYFYVHLHVLYKSGSGDGFFSSEFQSRLKGNSLYKASMPREVAYGAQITLKNHRTGGAYLHSHWHLYPEGLGARQQQVTTYSHKDDNNNWIIKKYDQEPNPKNKTVELVRNGDLIRLEHVV